MSLTREQLEFRQVWVEALRSGEYRQTANYLADEVEWDEEAGTVDYGYCCLGVACKVALDEGLIDADVDSYAREIADLQPLDDSYEGSTNPFTRVMELAGLADGMGSFTNREVATKTFGAPNLTILNDGRGSVSHTDTPEVKPHTFAEIADVIEAATLAEIL